MNRARDIGGREALLRTMFAAAVDQASAARAVPSCLPPPPRGRTVVVGAGKAAAAMARAVERNWEGSLSGLVVTRHGHGVPCERIEVREAGHPVPDAAGIAAAQAMRAQLDGLDEEDLVICLLSGGGSSLLAAPPPMVSLEDLQQVTRALLRSGAPISAMNCVRRHLSMVAGGRLALAAHRARLVTLAISDVPDDDPATIASGPTVPDPTTREDALAILEGLPTDIPASVRDWLTDPASETPKPGTLPPSAYRIVAGPQASLDAAARIAEAAGYTPVMLGGDLEGEARDLASDHARRVRERLALGGRWALLSGGEATVAVRGTGRGGRNAEFLLALAIELAGARGVHALAADTDGIDGSQDNAGAMIGPQTLARAAAIGIDPLAALDNNDGYGVFAALNALVITGPTLTNVNDFRVILIDADDGDRE